MALIGDHQTDAQAKTFLPQWPKIFFSQSKIQTVFIIIQTFTKVTFWHLAGLLIKTSLLTKNQQKPNDEEVLRFGMIMSVKIR